MDMPTSTERKTQPRKREIETEERISSLEESADRPTGTMERSERMGRIDDSVDKVRDRVTILETNFTTIITFADKTERALWGVNGNVGMVGRLKSVEDAIGGLNKLLWIVIGLVLSIAIGGIYEAVMHAAIANVK